MVIMGMEIPVAAIHRQIASGIDLMVHLSRMRAWGYVVLIDEEAEDRKRIVEALRSLSEPFFQPGGISYPLSSSPRWFRGAK